MDPREIIDSIIDIEQAKNIDKDKVINIIIEGLVKACKKQFGEFGEYKVTLNESTGHIDIKRMLKVVEIAEEPEFEISIEEAKEFDEDFEIGDEFVEELELSSFGRKAISAMYNHIKNNILTEERVSLFADYSGKVDTLVNGTIKKIDRKYVYINLQRIEAKMPIEEGIPGERYRNGQLIKAVILNVLKTKGDPEVILSRRADRFLQKLLEFEVPEIEEGSVIIKAIARIPGRKSKIAVSSIDDKIDPVGACVGVKGSRIHTIIRELNNEPIDIIQWSADPVIFTQRVISPGVVIRAFKNDDTKTMKLVVKDDTLAKAIGKEGINLELAMKITGWKMQIIGESEFRESQRTDEEINPIHKVKSLTDNQKEKLIEAGYSTPEEILEKGEEELEKIEGLGTKTIKKIIAAVKEYLNIEEN